MKGGPRNSVTHPIYIDFVPHSWEETSKAKLGITFAPGKKQKKAMTGSWDRDLKTDLHRIRHFYEIEALVCLLEDQEMKSVLIENEIEECKNIGIDAYRFPVVDDSIPEDHESYKKLVADIVDKYLRQGKNVVVHCLGGLGRAPTFAAACLIYSGISPSNAIETIRKSRSNTLNILCQL